MDEPFASFTWPGFRRKVAAGREKNKDKDTGRGDCTQSLKGLYFPSLFSFAKQKAFYCQFSPPTGWCLTTIFQKVLFIHHQYKYFQSLWNSKRTNLIWIFYLIFNIGKMRELKYKTWLQNIQANGSKNKPIRKTNWLEKVKSSSPIVFTKEKINCLKNNISQT